MQSLIAMIVKFFHPRALKCAGCVCPLLKFQPREMKKKEVSKVSSINETSPRGPSSGLVRKPAMLYRLTRPPTHSSVRRQAQWDQPLKVKLVIRQRGGHRGEGSC